MIILTSNYFTAAKPKVAQTTIYSTCTIFYYIHFLHEYIAPAYNCMTTNKTFVWTNQQLTVNSFPFGMILRIFSS